MCQHDCAYARSYSVKLFNQKGYATIYDPNLLNGVWTLEGQNRNDVELILNDENLANLPPLVDRIDDNNKLDNGDEYIVQDEESFDEEDDLEKLATMKLQIFWLKTQFEIKMKTIFLLLKNIWKSYQISSKSGRN